MVVFIPSVNADTYSTFQTTRYYSANRNYFVEVTEKKRATLYLNGRKLRRVWRKKIAELPNKLFVTNDGKRVVVFDRYYGNGGSPSTPVVVIFNENGDQIASHLLGDVANLKRVPLTTSAAHWYKESRLSSDEQSLLIETLVTKYDWGSCLTETAPEQREKCFETIPYQELRFVLITGELIERKNIASE